jgi:hypothetical protein
MPIRNYDRLFGGAPGAAEKARASMKKSYGAKRGETVFWATVYKREKRIRQGKSRRSSRS